MWWWLRQGSDIVIHDSSVLMRWQDNVLWQASSSHLSLEPLGPSSPLPLSELRQGFLATCPGVGGEALTPNIQPHDTTGLLLHALCVLPSSHSVCSAKLVNLININYKFSMQCIQFAWNESPINKIQITGLWSVMDESASLCCCSQYFAAGL